MRGKDRIRQFDPLSIFAIPLLAFGIIVIVGTLLVFAVIAQGVKNLREPDESFGESWKVAKGGAG